MALGNPSDIATGSALTAGSLITQLTGFEISGMGERSIVDVSYSTITNNWRQKLPGDLMDGGTVDASINFLTTELSVAKTAFAAAKATATITFPIPADGGTVAGVISAKQFVYGMDVSAPIKDEDVMSAVVHICIAGEPTMTNAT